MAIISGRYKINQYNWFGQKLLAQHRYGDILQVRQHLCATTASSQDDSDYTQSVNYNERLISDHYNYLTGLALMKTSTRPHNDQLMIILQKLNFQKTGQYFLLLCQCLLYLGNHDSLVAICKQVLNREINTIEAQDATTTTTSAAATETLQAQAQDQWSLEAICEESIEFRRILENVQNNKLINDARLWFIFALSLEYQHQLKDADFAYRVGSKLASTNQPLQTLEPETSTIRSIPISDYHLPQIKYAEFCLRHRNDYKTAIQVLCFGNSASSQTLATSFNYDLSPALAMALCGQSRANANDFKRAKELFEALDGHSMATRNPSFVYNQIALKCRQKLYQYIGSESSTAVQDDLIEQPAGLNDVIINQEQRRQNLDYVLIKSHVLLNDIIYQNNNNNSQNHDSNILYKANLLRGKQQQSNKHQEVVDNLIESLRSCTPSCWLSYSLWNNLGLCYLMKRRYIASFTCLTKAHELNPLDWRINYNLSLVSLHVDVALRALICSLASSNFQQVEFHRLATFNNLPANITSPRHQLQMPMGKFLLANCYAVLRLRLATKRLYSEMIAIGQESSSGSGGDYRTPVHVIVNYLLLIHRPNLNEQKQLVNSEEQQLQQDDDKLMARLLDILEQTWLQRNPNDIQFATIQLDTAKHIGEVLQKRRPQMRSRTFAWDKV